MINKMHYMHKFIKIIEVTGNRDTNDIYMVITAGPPGHFSKSRKWFSKGILLVEANISMINGTRNYHFSPIKCKWRIIYWAVAGKNEGNRV